MALDMTQDITACLVCMPAAAVERPSIALGLLKTILEQAGLATAVMYPNLWYLDYVGRDDTVFLDGFRPEEAVVDWVFGAAAFPDFAPDHDAYLARLAQRNGQADTLRPRLLALREQAPAFIEWAASRILAARPRIVGCTSMFQQHVASLALLRRIKELSPGTITVMGGANCESIMGRTTHQHFPWVDYVVSGEADGFVAPLFQAIARHGRDIPAAELPDGVFAPIHRSTSYPVSAVGDGVPRAITEDIRDLPLPDYDDYFTDLARSTYADSILPGLPMEFSRGCWWGQRSHCTFCGLNGGSMNFRAKRPADVLTDMQTLAARYGSRKIEAVDNIMDLAYFDTVLPALANDPDPWSIFFETKSNLKRHQVALLQQAGVRWIQPGIESLHSGVLALMRKGAAAWTNVQLLKWGRLFGVRLSWSLICGFPGEDDAWYTEMAALIPALEHLQPGPAIALRYDRYSPYLTDPASFGLRLQPSELYRYAYPLPPDALANQVYFFEAIDGVNEPRRVTGKAHPTRHGLTATRHALERWNTAWKGADLPALTLHQDHVTDTRSCATAAAYSIDPVELALLQLTDDAPPEAKLRTAMQQQGHADAATEQALSRLLALRLIVRLDGRLIGLPLHAPCAPLPGAHAFPGGYFANRQSMLQRLLALA